MKITVLGMTQPFDIEERVNEDNMLEIGQKFAGSQAGICYMNNGYFGTNVTNPEKALKRFKRIIPTGHHSIADHVQINLLLENIPKILAMFLNNVGYYATSEKSARYTNMKNINPDEKKLYDKWYDIFLKEIEIEYGDKIEESRRDKLAKENARYFLSVFTPTTMGYTVSLRQLNYIINWLENYNFEMIEQNFRDRLSGVFEEFKNHINKFKIDGLDDTKSRRLDLISHEYVYSVKEEFNSMYLVKYEGSFAQLAQAQRHRTLNHRIAIPREKTFYVPELLKTKGREELAKEWLTDMHMIKYHHPQGMNVLITESGMIEDFVAKAKERLCGRAQLEIARQTEENYKKISKGVALNKKSNIYIKNELEEMLGNSKNIHSIIKSKCEVVKCKEPCVWGAKHALSRLI